ncbi:hypothetical protein N9L75_07335 [Porticoccaceae bacterium]|nr:hypothetical protein [Porticoccaceae bacterium]
MSKIDFIALQAASEAFATDPLPDEWLEMSDEQQNEWLDDHKRQPFENDTNDDFLDFIDAHSDTVKNAVKEVLKVLKEQLIEVAIECELPSDFNELNLQAMLGMESSK